MPLTHLCVGFLISASLFVYRVQGIGIRNEYLGRCVVFTADGNSSTE